METIREEEQKKRGRRTGNQGEQNKKNKEQTKFIIDVSKDKSSQELILKLLESANNKEHGREVSLKDIVVVALSKLTPKDLEKIQEDSLSEMEKVEKALLEYNKKNNSNLTLGEFLVKKLGIH
jgi:hypothetical protein